MGITHLLKKFSILLNVNKSNPTSPLVLLTPSLLWKGKWAVFERCAGLISIQMELVP